MSLLERFQEGSELDSHGHFTLDESRAREKMARFQLANPEEFLMLVVQAAVASACSSLELTLEGNEIRVLAREALFDGESLRSLQPFLFDSQPDNVAYHLLAVAANAVEPSCVGSPLVAMVDDDLLFKVNLKESLGDLSALLSRRLRYFPVPLSLNGRPLETEPLLEGTEVVLAPRSGPSTLVLVRFGVTVVEKSRMLPIEYRAVARADHLSLDASFSRVVEDARFVALLATLDAKANELLARRATRYKPEDPDTADLLAHLRAGHPDPAGQALDKCPFFPYADRPGFASLAELRRLASQEGKLMVSVRNYNLQLDTPVVRIDDQVLHRLLRDKLPSSSFEDAGSAFLVKATAAKNKALWESSPRPTELPPGRYLGQTHVSGLTWEAAVGFLAAPGGGSRMDVLYQGKLLNNEALSDAPPGSAVVLNVRQAEVHPTWTRLDGRQYRAILKELQERLREAFTSLEIRDPEQLYPQLSSYLLGHLHSKQPPAVALHAPLFTTVEADRTFTLLELKRLDEVACGDAVRFSEKIPGQDLLPSPLLRYSPSHFQALCTALGPNRVKDVRKQQAWLLGIEEQMKNPRTPVLPPGDHLLCKEPFEFRSCRGEIALTNDVGGKLDATLIKDGAAFETLKAFAGRVLSAVAAVDCPALTLNATWNGFVTNDEYSKLQTALREQALRMELELLERPLEPNLKIKLVRAYLQEKTRYWTQDLFETTQRDQLASLARLEAEISEHGCLLQGQPNMTIPGRLILLRPGKESSNLLEETLGAFRWEDAGVLIRQLEQTAEFEGRQVHQEISLGGSYPVLLSVPEGRGQLGIHPARSRGEAQCFVRGRYVCTKAGVVPAPFAAAIESETFVLREDFLDVQIPLAYRAMLDDLCAQAMLEAARHPQLELRELGWAYFTKSTSPRLAEFRTQTLLPPFEGEAMTLAAIAESKIRGYVSPSFSTSVKPKGLVLRLSADEARRLSAFLGRTLTDLQEELKAEEVLQRKLAELPGKLPQSLYQKRFEADQGLSAIIGLSLERKTIGLDLEGRPVGLLRELTMPVQVLVFGAEPDPKKAKELRAQIPAKAWKQLGDWSERLCLDWVKNKADDWEILRHLLSLTTREIGSRSTPLAEMASLLWDMPLFNRVDGTRVSGSALATTLSQTEQPILVSDRTFRVPGSAVHLPEGSHERSILTSVLGKSQLLWYQVPPLFDPKEVRASVVRLVSWGFSPVTRSIAAVGKLLEKSAAKPKKEPEKRKRDPREALIVALKEDVANLLGREHYNKSDNLFRALDFGHWPLGPPLYRRSDGSFRLNALHSGIRWLLAEEEVPGEAQGRQKRTARVLLLVHWVGLVNEASEELKDPHEDAFLQRLAERMTQTFTRHAPKGEATATSDSRGNKHDRG